MAGGHIDFDHLEKYVSGDDSLRDEILEIFTGQVNDLVGSLDAELSDEAWKDRAHKLKGASRGVGAWALGEFAEQAEALIGDAPGKAEARSTLLVSLRHAAQGAMEEAANCRLAIAG